MSLTRTQVYYIPPHIKPVAYEDNGEPIYLARGVVFTEEGHPILTAFPTPYTVPRTPDNPYGCSW